MLHRHLGTFRTFRDRTGNVCKPCEDGTFSTKVGGGGGCGWTCGSLSRVRRVLGWRGMERKHRQRSPQSTLPPPTTNTRLTPSFAPRTPTARPAPPSLCCRRQRRTGPAPPAFWAKPSLLTSTRAAASASPSARSLRWRRPVCVPWQGKKTTSQGALSRRSSSRAHPDQRPDLQVVRQWLRVPGRGESSGHALCCVAFRSNVCSYMFPPCLPSLPAFPPSLSRHAPLITKENIHVRRRDGVPCGSDRKYSLDAHIGPRLCHWCVCGASALSSVVNKTPRFSARAPFSSSREPRLSTAVTL